MRPSITIHVEGDFDLEMEEFYPDGVPENVTIDEIVAVLKEWNPSTLMSDWNLVPAISVSYHKPDLDASMHFITTERKVHP